MAETKSTEKLLKNRKYSKADVKTAVKSDAVKAEVKNEAKADDLAEKVSEKRRLSLNKQILETTW